MLLPGAGSESCPEAQGGNKVWWCDFSEHSEVSSPLAALTWETATTI